MITPEMLIVMTNDVLKHAQKHMYEARSILLSLKNDALTLDEKLTLITRLKNHVGIVQGDAARALNIIGD